MRRRSRRLLAAFVVSVTSVALVTAGAFVASATVGSRPTIMTAVPEVPYTAFTVDGRQGSYQLTGTRAMDTVTGSATGEKITMTGTHALGSWSVELRPPSGLTWSAGTYALSRSTGGTPSSSAGFISLSGEGRGCNQQDGSLTVHEVARSGANVSVFAATFLIGCEAAADVVLGELRWNSTIEWQAVGIDRDSVNFGTSVPVGTPTLPQVVTVTGKGTLPVTMGAASLTGTDADAFAITADTCAGAILDYDESCSISVVAQASDAGVLQAGLSIPDDTAGGPKLLPVFAIASGAPPTTATTPPPTTTTPPPPPAWNNEGTFYPLEPARILDTREGNGAPKAKLGAGKELVLDVAGRGGVPDQGVSAVVLNVTVTNPTAGSFLTVYPAGQSRPVASSLNFVPGWTGANMVTVGLGSGGAVRIYNHAGTVDVIADVVGFYAADGSMVGALGTGSHYNTGSPFRVFDSREDWGERLEAGYAARVWLPVGEVWAPHITAVAVNVTAVDGVAPGFLTTWDGEGDPPLASTLNFVRGNVVPNMAIVPVSLCDECDGSVDGIAMPSIGIYTNVDTHLVVDVMGIFDDAELGEAFRFRPMAPQRIVDSRSGQGLSGALGRGQTRTVNVPSSIVADDVFGLALNVTAVDPTAYSFVSVWPEGFSQPTVSNLNTAPGQTLPNSVYTMLGWVSADFNVYNHDGRTHLVVDVVGTFYIDLDDTPSLAGSPRPSAQSRWLEGDAGPALLQRSGRDGFAVG